MQVTRLQGKGNCEMYTVVSKFKQPGVGAPFTLTVTLGSWTNGFYDKHVLRKDESSRDTFRERKALMGAAGADWTKAGTAVDKGIFTGANRSTFIRLKNIDLHAMVYGLAKALVENYRANAWPGGVGTYNAHLPTEAVFEAPQCVASYDPAGAKSYARSIKIGGKLVAANGNTVSFDLDHCGGAGAV